MSYIATSEDWYELLGLTSVFPAVFRGEVTLAATRAALAQSRQRWPGTNADYVAMIDGFSDAMLDVGAAILEQGRSLSALRKSIADIEESVPEEFAGDTNISAPPNPVDRLLTANEQSLLSRISQELEDLAGEIAAWGDSLEDDADEAEDAADEAEQEAEDEEGGED